jgi:hypothetical protein
MKNSTYVSMAAREEDTERRKTITEGDATPRPPRRRDLPRLAWLIQDSFTRDYGRDKNVIGEQILLKKYEYQMCTMGRGMNI